MSTDNYVGQDLEALADIPNYQNWILDHFRPHLHGRVLEIGAGIGTLSSMYRSNVDSAVLLEPAANLIAPLRDRFRGDEGVKVIGKPLEDAIAARDVEDGSFDAVVLINVLEHVDDDTGMLIDIARLLKPGGMLLLFVPALQWLFGSLDTLVSHRRRYAKSQLRFVVENASLAVRDLRYFDVLGVLPWFVTGRLIKAREFNAKAARLYDTVAVPVGSRVEKLVAPPIGKNLMCIAQRSRE